MHVFPYGIYILPRTVLSHPVVAERCIFNYCPESLLAFPQFGLHNFASGHFFFQRSIGLFQFCLCLLQILIKVFHFEHCFYFSKQLVCIDRRNQVIICPAVQSFDAALNVPECCRYQDNRNMIIFPVRPDVIHQFISIHYRHLNIGDYNIRWF